MSSSTNASSFGRPRSARFAMRWNPTCPFQLAIESAYWMRCRIASVCSTSSTTRLAMGLHALAFAFEEQPSEVARERLTPLSTPHAFEHVGESLFQLPARACPAAAVSR